MMGLVVFMMEYTKNDAGELKITQMELVWCRGPALTATYTYGGGSLP